MKVVLYIPDKLLKDVQDFSEGKHLADSINKALSDWVHNKRIRKLNNQLKMNPLEFKKGFSAESIRESDRQSNSND
jgi:hypothetical protein